VEIFENGNLRIILDGCEKKDRKSQKMLYEQFFGYALSICMRYTPNEYYAMEVLNDAFMKVFTQLKKFDHTRSFKSWFRKILINTSIDHLKKEVKHQHHQKIEGLEIENHRHTVDHQIQHEELIGLIQQLTPAYRSVFNLYVIDGYQHDEIARMLRISIGTSKSNLAKARKRLREMLSKIDKNEIVRFIR